MASKEVSSYFARSNSRSRSILTHKKGGNLRSSFTNDNDNDEQERRKYDFSW